MNGIWFRRTPSAASLRRGAVIFVTCLAGLFNLPILVKTIMSARSRNGYDDLCVILCLEVTILAPMPLFVPALLQLFVMMRSWRRTFAKVEAANEPERRAGDVLERTVVLAPIDCVGARQCKTRAGIRVILPVQRGEEDDSRVMNVSDEESAAAILVAGGGHRRAPLGPFRLAVRMGSPTRGGRFKSATIFAAIFIACWGASRVWPDARYLSYLLVLPPFNLALAVLLVVVPWVYLMKEIYSYVNLVVDADGIRLGELGTTYGRLRSTTLEPAALRVVMEADAGSPQEWVIRPLRSHDWQQLEIIKDIIDHGLLHAAVGHAEPPGVYRAEEGKS
jgi:hypothetical protein